MGSESKAYSIPESQWSAAWLDRYARSPCRHVVFFDLDLAWS
jgi:hypothetical protein